MQSFQLHERASTVPTPHTRQDWQRGYESVKEESDYWIDDVEGQIPPELQGTLFRNGPGLLEVNGQRIHHPFDGDGMISAIAFRDGRAHFQTALSAPQHKKNKGWQNLVSRRLWHPKARWLLANASI